MAMFMLRMRDGGQEIPYWRKTRKGEEKTGVPTLRMREVNTGVPASRTRERGMGVITRKRREKKGKLVLSVVHGPTMGGRTGVFI